MLLRPCSARPARSGRASSVRPVRLGWASFRPLARFARCRLTLGAALVSLGLVAGSAQATTLTFDGLLSGSASSAAAFAGVNVVDALVLSEADAALLTGFATAGTWATSGNQGLLNTLQGQVELSFDAPVTSFSVDVLGLPDPLGGVTGVQLTAWSGGGLVGMDVSDVSLIGDSGLHEDTLAFSGSADRIVLSPVFGCPACEPVSVTTSFWADTVVYESVPEAGPTLLLLAALLPLARRRR